MMYTILKKIIPVSWHYSLSNAKHIFFGYKKYSQFGEDEVLLKLFKSKSNGRYVDVGAHHPYRYSNTYLLHKKGWSGVNIDPNPHTISLFNKARLADENICCGVGETGTLTYYEFSDPAVNSFKKSEAGKWQGKSFIRFLGTSEIQINPLSKLVEGEIDVLTIDVEGMDLEVLRSYNWKHFPKVIVAEGEESKEFLIEKGYRLYKKCGLSRIYVFPKIYIVYEEGHIDEAEAWAEAGTTIICLDYLLEEECKKKKIPFTPLRTFVDQETGEERWWKMSHDICREWYRLPTMDFFKYKDIRIAEAPEPIMQAYLAKIFYFVRIFIFLKKAFPEIPFYISEPLSQDMSSECLMAFQSWTILDAACMVGLAPPRNFLLTSPQIYVFERGSLRSSLLKIYNFLMNLTPHKRHKIYLSGYWGHSESLVPLLHDTEVIILETKKFRNVPWKERLEHRMRFMYSHVPISWLKKKKVREIGEKFRENWKNSKKDVEAYLQTIDKDLDWSPIVHACEHLVTYTPRIVADIDTLFAIMKKEKPHVVLQMASVGGPHHYFLLMAHIARALTIPSVELEHATVTIDPRSVFCRIETDYLLTYGEIINEWHRRIGNTSQKLIAVGSPRFDKYVHEQDEGLRKGREIFKGLGLDITRPVLLVAVPFSETYASAVDSYLLQEFFEAISQIQQKTLGLQIVFKCRVPRLVEGTRAYIEKLFSKDFVITGNEDIFPFICASDGVVCNNSTVIYQAVLAKKPLILYPWKSFDSYHAKLYASHIPLLYTREEAIETLKRIFSDSSYRDKLLSLQEEFLKEYLFDGNSSKRVADFILNLH